MGEHFLLQGIFSIQGWNLRFWHSKHILYHLSHREVPKEAKNSLVYSLYEWFFTKIKCFYYETTEHQRSKSNSLYHIVFLIWGVCVCVCVCVCVREREAWFTTFKRVALAEITEVENNCKQIFQYLSVGLTTSVIV